MFDALHRLKRPPRPAAFDSRYLVPCMCKPWAIHTRSSPLHSGRGALKMAAGVAMRTTVAAVGGGVGSALSGGGFADGAYSAAFFHLFNNEAGAIKDALGVMKDKFKTYGFMKNNLGELYKTPTGMWMIDELAKHVDSITVTTTLMDPRVNGTTIAVNDRKMNVETIAHEFQHLAESIAQYNRSLPFGVP